MRRNLWLKSLACAFVVAAPVVAADWWRAAPAGDAASLDALFGDKSDHWKVAAGKFTIETDKSLNAAVLTAAAGQPVMLEGQTRYGGAHEIRARLRLRTDIAPNVAAYLHFGMADAADPGFCVTLAGNRNQNIVHVTIADHGKAFHDNAALAKVSEHGPGYARAVSMSYNLRSFHRILPGWEESYRAGIEAAMSQLPDLENKWVDVRIAFRKGLVRVWADDRLVATRTDPAPEPQGFLKIGLSPGAQMASYDIQPLQETPGYTPIELGGYANARAFLGEASVDSASLPPAGRVVTVGGVPFVFSGVNPEGNDHIDVGQSLFRQANTLGYLPAYHNINARWNGATWRDPARIQVRVPQDFYDGIELIAAADEDDDSIPLVSAMFYRPGAGYVQSSEARVPIATARSSEAEPLPVRLSNRKKANLWRVRIPIDPAMLTSFADLDIVEIEFSKKVQQYRSYPDPISYGYHQGGLPSSVHIYAATLTRSPVAFEWKPDRFGHVWTSPEVAAYTATITNRSASPIQGKLTVTTRSFDGTETTTQESPVNVAVNVAGPVKLQLPVKLNGYHDLVATLDIGGKSWTEKRSFVRLAPDTRSAKWTAGKGALFSYWSYHGGHNTPAKQEVERLMSMAGARFVPATMGNPWFVSPQAWAADEPKDATKVAEFQKAVVKALQDHDEKQPAERRSDDLYLYPEPHISARLTAGNLPEYWGDPPLVYTEEENRNLRVFMETSKLAAQAYRAAFPGRKILIPWGDPGFAIPLLRAGFPKDLIDGSALDVPGFERIPERQLHEQSIHRLYALRKEYEKAGIPNPRLQFNEGIFVPTEPGAVTWREQMDIYQRWTLLSMAYGVDRFYSGWFAFDCGNYYGAEHYGGCGIQRRIPYCDPKPAYAAYATMTDKLNDASFDGWVHTGSLTTYCLRFKHDTRGFVYALWTLRGKRPVTLTLGADAKVNVTDSMNNTTVMESKDKAITVVTDASVIYVSGAGEITTAAVEQADHTDAIPAKDARLIADLGDGSWKYTSRRDATYEHNHWGIYPALGRFSAAVADDSIKGKVLVSTLGQQERIRELMPWYNTLTPRKPIRIEGAPSHIGLWVKGSSDWGRVIYILRDDRGERWISIGTKDDYNCDDPHSWSSFNFDGWRYLRFEMPGHLGYDNYRRIGTTWWGSSATAASSPSGKPEGDNIVDLPLTLEEIIVEQRTHLLYVNDIQPAASNAVSLGKMYIEYEKPEDATSAAVKESRLRMPRPKDLPALPNPIERLTREGVGAPTRLTGLEAPSHYYDGTRMHVKFDEVAGAKKYNLWVGPYKDGRGAIDMVPTGIKPGQLITGLRPGVKLYYWVVYTDANDKASKPSAVHEEVTVDNFKEK